MLIACMRTIVIALLLMGSGFAQSTQFSFSIRSKPVFQNGSEVQIFVALTNWSEAPVYVPRRGPVFGYEYEVRDEDGRLLPETQYFYRLKHPDPEGILVNPGGSMVEPGRETGYYVSIGLYYDMSQPGKYSIMVKRKPDNLIDYEMDSNVIEVTVAE